MNLTDVKMQLGIAKQQATISEGKMNFWLAAGHEFKTKVYRVRMKALHCYINDLKKQLRNNDRKQIKRNNNN